MTCGKASDGDGRGECMAVDAKVFGTGVGAVEHDVVGPQKLASGHDFESQAEDVPTVNSMRVGVMDLEGGDGAADAMEALLDVGALLVGLGEELFAGRVRSSEVVGDGRWLENGMGRGSGKNGRGFDLEVLAQGGSCMFVLVGCC